MLVVEAVDRNSSVVGYHREELFLVAVCLRDWHMMEEVCSAHAKFLLYFSSMLYRSEMQCSAPRVTDTWPA